MCIMIISLSQLTLYLMSIYNILIVKMQSYAKIVTYLDLQGDISVNCSCKNFEASGWLCFHCLRILHNHSISKNSEKYISPCWTKHAKKEVWERMFNDANKCIDDDNYANLKMVTSQ